MSALLKTHKRLWTRAGDECAFPGCGQSLLVPLEGDDDETVVGKECHIIAQADGGPRGLDTLTAEERERWHQLIANRDGYANLVLMCGVHHDVIDGDTAAYTIERLIDIKKAHESAVRDRRTARQQHEDNVQVRYAAIVDEWAARVELDAWQRRLSSLVSDGFVSDRYMERLEDTNLWLLRRVWPRTLPRLESAFLTFRQVSQDLIAVVRWYSTERGGRVLVDRAYNEYAGPGIDTEFLVRRSTYNNELAADLAIELTRAANLICDLVREHLWPDYRLAEGRVTIGLGLDENLSSRVFVALYPMDCEELPYPGLRTFLEARTTRDLSFGSGMPPTGAGLPGLIFGDEE